MPGWHAIHETIRNYGVGWWCAQSSDKYLLSCNGFQCDGYKNNQVLLFIFLFTYRKFDFSLDALGVYIVYIYTFCELATFYWFKLNFLLAIILHKYILYQKTPFHVIFFSSTKDSANLLRESERLRNSQALADNLETWKVFLMTLPSIACQIDNQLTGVR